MEVAARPVDAVGDLKTFEALGHAAELVAVPPPRRAAPRAPTCDDEVLSLSGDPFAPQPCGPLRGRARAAPGLVDPDGLEAEEAAEEDLVGCAPSELEPFGVAEEMDVDARSDSANELGSVPEVGYAGDEAFGDAATDVGLWGFDGEEDASGTLTTQDFVRASAISFTRFVSCTLPPWMGHSSDW